jgi:hypothetical protein
VRARRRPSVSQEVGYKTPHLLELDWGFSRLQNCEKPHSLWYFCHTSQTHIRQCLLPRPTLSTPQSQWWSKWQGHWNGVGISCRVLFCPELHSHMSDFGAMYNMNWDNVPTCELDVSRTFASLITRWGTRCHHLSFTLEDILQYVSDHRNLPNFINIFVPESSSCVLLLL